MSNINQLVKTVQAEGTDSLAFVELFEIIQSETIEPKAFSFSKQLKGDVAEAVSEGYILLMELVESWDGTGNFHTLFKTSYTNRIINLVKKLGRDKRKHNTSYDISLSESASSNGETSPIIEVLDDKSLTSNFDITAESNVLNTLMDEFKTVKPEQAGVIEILTTYPDDSKQAEKTSELCKYYGVTEYKTIQKKVSRCREAFEKFLVKKGYVLGLGL